MSCLFRMLSVANGCSYPEMPNLSVNTHPVEVFNVGLLESRGELRAANPKQVITLEVHKTAVADQNQMAELRASLDELNMQLAYHDFGAGQSRLPELFIVRPDYLKFDVHMIRDIDKVSTPQLKMLKVPVDIALELEILTSDRGRRESEGEHETCSQVGF